MRYVFLLVLIPSYLLAMSSLPGTDDPVTEDEAREILGTAERRKLIIPALNVFKTLGRDNFEKLIRAWNVSDIEHLPVAFAMVKIGKLPVMQRGKVRAIISESAVTTFMKNNDEKEEAISLPAREFLAVMSLAREKRIAMGMDIDYSGFDVVSFTSCSVL